MVGRPLPSLLTKPTAVRAMFCYYFVDLPLLVSLQADISWSVNGIPKGIVKQSLGQVPIMVKSKLCNLHGLSPKELIERHEEAEVRTVMGSAKHYYLKSILSTSVVHHRQNISKVFNILRCISVH